MYQIGFDVGGSKIAGGVVDDGLKILARRSIPFPKGEDYREVASRMAGMVRELAGEMEMSPDDFKSIGAAVPGSLDPEKERVIHAYNLQFHNAPFREALQSHFPSIPVYLANDADAAALAELYAGAFRGCKTAALLTLGTGVGGGLILCGKMFTGGMGHGVELGHIPLNYDGKETCTCGNRGCIETLCSATWLNRQGKKAAKKHPDCLIAARAKGRVAAVNAKVVIDCAKEGDKTARDIFDRYVNQLSSAITAITVLLDPEVIALGGGVSLAGDFLFVPLRKQVEEKSFFKYPHKVVPAEMGNEAGIVGAAMLAKNDSL